MNREEEVHEHLLPPPTPANTPHPHPQKHPPPPHQNNPPTQNLPTAGISSTFYFSRNKRKTGACYLGGRVINEINKKLKKGGEGEREKLGRVFKHPYKSSGGKYM